MRAETQVDVSYYFDSRDFNTWSIFLLNKNLGAGFSFLGFTDFHSDQNKANDRYDVTRTFSEYRLSNNKIADWLNIDGMALQLEYNDITPGSSNNTFRFGLTYQSALSQNHWLQWRLFPVDSRNDHQISLIYFLTFSDKLNLSGFADYNFVKNGKNQWIVEPQLNYKLHSRLWILLEYRYNGFEDNNPYLDGSGTALGIRYHF